ncbi:MAG: alpha/beta hydrolase [Spirochaetales bacterium]|nr:alpha/beta hydrolase [Spirochaetales bacterium]
MKELLDYTIKHICLYHSIVIGNIFGVKVIIKDFGNKNNKKIILLHGGGLSWWSWGPIIDILQKKYNVITPIIDGHAEDGENTFISIDDTTNKLITYIDENFNGQIFLLCGLSIGAQIALNILSKRNDICKYSVIESALVKPIKFLKSLLLPMARFSYPLIKQKWYSRLQAKTLFVPTDKMDIYYADSCKMSKQSLSNIILSNGSFKLNSEISNTKAQVLILVGEKEIKIMKQSAIEIHKLIKNSQLEIIADCGHGEISLLRPKEYCRYLYDLIDHK